MPTDTPRSAPLTLYASAFVVVAWILHFLLRGVYEPGHSLRLFVTALLIAGFVLVLMAQVQVIRSLDEFQRQVQLLALAIGFGCSLVAMVAIGFLRAEGLLQGADPRDLPGLMMLLYLVGLGLAWRRYA